MDWLSIDYRDPLFGIIILFATIFVVSFVGHTMKKNKDRKRLDEQSELVKRFELGDLDSVGYIELYVSGKLPLETILLMSNIFCQKGDFSKAISIFLALLEKTDDTIKKEEILEQLGKIYFRTGLLQRSKDIFLRILKFSPRNKDALFYLLLSYEKMKDYKSAIEVLEPLVELGRDTSKDKPYLFAMKIVSDATLSNERKIEQLETLFCANNFIERIFVSFLIRFDIKIFWQKASIFDFQNIIDILWYLPKEMIDIAVVEKKQYLSDLYSAKGYFDISSYSDIFEFDLMILNKNRQIKNSSFDFNFEYLCEHCKKTHYVYDYRCQSCHYPLVLHPTIKFAKLNFEKNNSFQ